jgi:site-specific DNA-methyltransferase (adenine-specific)
MRQLRPNIADMAYLDPPFLTQKVQRLTTRDRTHTFSFHDVWSSHHAYAEFLGERLQEVWRVISPTGSVFLHCDRNASHIARAVLDEVFGDDMFRSEIIWSYRRWAKTQKALLPAHQTIFFYTKTADYKFNPIYEDYSPSTNVDQILQRRKRDGYGKAVYERDDSGRPVLGGDKKGVPLSDVWDIPYLNPKAKERVGYPTQKPVLLLERIIQLATDAGDTVLDPFCGSGTTLVAAKRLGRNSIGIDISSEAAALASNRLDELIRSDSRLFDEGRDAYFEANEEALALLLGLDFVPVHRNRGIDAILKQSIDGQNILIRVQRPSEPLGDAAEALHRAAKSKNGSLKVLVVLEAGGELDLGQDFPDMIRVNAPAESIRRSLRKLLKPVSSFGP